MKDRLEQFRKQIAAFDGAADPMHAIARGYVVEEPHQSSTNTLFKRISLKPQSKNLLIGGIGSGKTTQLLRLEQSFEQDQNVGIFPLYIDVTQYAESNDIQAGTLDAIIGLELIALFTKLGSPLDERRVKPIREFAFGHYEDNNINRLSEPRPIIRVKVPGVLSHKIASSPSLRQLAKVLSSLIEDFQAKFHQTPYFLFDGLDRLYQEKNFAQIASLDLQSTQIGFLIVGSASVLYSNFIDSDDRNFNHIEYRAAVDVQNDPDAYIFLRDVLLARAEPNFFQADALQDLIYLSGGVLRDLINLTQEAIQEAYLADAEVVEQEHVQQAVRSMGRAKSLGLTKEQYSTLNRLITNTLEAPTSPEEIYLLATGRILEYRYPQRRFDIHPTLKQLVAV